MVCKNHTRCRDDIIRVGQWFSLLGHFTLLTTSIHFSTCTFAILWRAFPRHLKQHILHFIHLIVCAAPFSKLGLLLFSPLIWRWSSVKNFPSYFPFVSVRQSIEVPFIWKTTTKTISFSIWVNTTNGRQRTGQSEPPILCLIPTTRL